MRTELKGRRQKAETPTQVKRAQELGAAAVLIYSDPRDDGTVTAENGYEA